MSEMTALALPAGEWTQATVGASLEVTIGALGPVSIIVFVGDEEPAADSFVGALIACDRRERLPIEAGDEVWIRTVNPLVAARALVWPHAEPAP